MATSINVIKFTEKYKSGLDPTAKYSFYSTIQWLQEGIWNRLLDLNLDFSFESQTKLTALHGNNLADYVSYNAMRYTYLKGGGWGSCYIAELYADFGYIGVFLGNILYGVLINGVLKGISKKNSIWLTACGFLVIDSLFKAPRGTFDDFLRNFEYIYNLGIPIIVYIIVNMKPSKRLIVIE